MTWVKTISIAEEDVELMSKFDKDHENFSKALSDAVKIYYQSKESNTVPSLWDDMSVWRKHFESFKEDEVKLFQLQITQIDELFREIMKW